MENLLMSSRILGVLTYLDHLRKLKRLVVDVAHSILALVRDFRSEQEQLSLRRGIFPNLPVMSLMAAA
jgi:superfamily II DNA helicase RecQ